MATRRQRRERRERQAQLVAPGETAPPEVAEVEPLTFQRARPPSIRLDENQRAKIVQRVLSFADEDRRDRQDDMAARVQRRAKLEMVKANSHRRWRDSADFPLSDLAADCLGLRDTLVNAAMSTWPLCEAQAVSPQDEPRCRRASLLLQHQTFDLQDGERLVDDCFADLVEEGQYRILVEWVKEKRRISQTRKFGRMDPKQTPREYMENAIRANLQMTEQRVTGASGWEWRARTRAGDWLDLSFYTLDDGRMAVQISGEVTTFNAPKMTRYAYENVLHPYWCENLQAPGPSNPNGASHVILVDTPTLGEVEALVRSGEYDRVTLRDVSEGDHAAVKSRPGAYLHELSIEEERDVMRGFSEHVSRRSQMAKNHGLLVRYTCYDVWQRGDGTEEDVIWTVLPELDLLVRAVPLGEDCPILPPKRPIAEGVCINIPGRCVGKSVAELGEAAHDLIKYEIDAMVDGGDLEMTPVFTYPISGVMDDTDYAIYPGAGLPERSPGDVRWLQINPQSGAVAANIITIAQRYQQDVTMRGELQAGRIPAGKSAALRNKGTVEQLLIQGEARPQRLLARAFKGLRDAWSIGWSLNQHFLDPATEFRVLGAPESGEELIRLEEGDLSGDVRFRFVATVFNASKQAQQEGFQRAVDLLISPVSIQDGWTTPEDRYRLAMEMLRAYGVKGEKYASGPTPDAGEPRISAETAFGLIVAGIPPDGVPAEPSVENHVKRLGELLQTPGPMGAPIGKALSPQQQQALALWGRELQAFAQEQAQLQAQAAAAAQLQTQRQQGAGQPGAPAAPQGGGPVQRNDVIDESLPASGTPQ